MESKIYWIDGRQTGWSKRNANSKSKVNLVSILQLEFTSCLEITTLKWNKYFIGGQTRMEIHARHSIPIVKMCLKIYSNEMTTTIYDANDDFWPRAHTLTDTHSISLWRDPFILILFILLCFSLEIFFCRRLLLFTFF